MNKKFNCEYYKNDSIEVVEVKEDGEVLVNLSLLLDDNHHGLLLTKENALLLAEELMKIANVNKNV